MTPDQTTRGLRALVRQQQHLAADLRALTDLARDMAVLADAGLQTRVLETLRPLRPFGATGIGKQRIGSPNDGGYVCLDDWAEVQTALSCGINDDDTFDLALAERGITVLQFDHTIAAAPSVHPRLQFFRERIVPAPAPGGRTLGQLVAAHRTATPSLLLKIDIEYDEWPVFDAIDPADLGQFRQIVCEFHGLEDIARTAFGNRAIKVLQKLDRQFFVCHIHANNFGGASHLSGVFVPHTLEVTYANRALYRPVDNRELFPTALDAPCHPDRPDYRLGCFWF